jgi:hypothetical protein
MKNDNEFQFNHDAEGNLLEVIPPKHLRPHIATEASWYKDMMEEIRRDIKYVCETRTPPLRLPATVIDEIAVRINEEASLIAKVRNEQKGRGRPRNVGAEMAAAAAQKIADDLNLPASGDWEDSLTADLLTMIERVSRQEKCRKEPVTGNRKARLKKGRGWKIGDWNDG